MNNGELKGKLEDLRSKIYELEDVIDENGDVNESVVLLEEEIESFNLYLSERY